MDPEGAGGSRQCSGFAEPAPAGPRHYAAEPGDSPGGPAAPQSSRRAPPPDSRRFRLGLLGESSALWLGKDDGRRRAPAGTVGCSQSSPLEVLRAEPGSSCYWAQRHFRFISAPPPEPVAERGIAVVRTDGNPSYGDRGRWLVPDSERSMAGPPHRGSRAPRLPSAFLGPRGEREEGAVGQEVGPFALPIAVLPVPPLCPCRAGPRERTVSEPRQHVAAGKVVGRSGPARAEGAVEGGGRGPLGPAAGAAPFPHRRGRGRAGAAAAPGCAGVSARAVALCKGEGARTGWESGPGCGPEERPRARAPPRWSLSRLGRPEPSPVGSALLLTRRPGNAVCSRHPEGTRSCLAGAGGLLRARQPVCPRGSRDLCASRQCLRAVGQCPPGLQRGAPGTSPGSGPQRSAPAEPGGEAVVPRAPWPLGSTGWKGEKAAGEESAWRTLPRGKPRGPALGPAAWGKSCPGLGVASRAAEVREVAAAAAAAARL